MIFLTGGARSGKSRLAMDALAGWPGEVTYIATAHESDEEMIDRISLHRQNRPEFWSVTEEPTDLGGAIAATRDGSALIVDCLTLWVSNLMETRPDDEILRLSDAAGKAAATRESPTIVVSNEVGSGLVPLSPVGRRFRDLHGRVNQTWATLAAEAYLAIAGMALPLTPGRQLFG